MSSGSLIDTLIGMSLLFGTLSLCSSALVELWAMVIDRRAKQLQVQLKNMMGDEWLKQFMAHPLINGMQEESTPPSYIEPAIFRQALLDLVRKDLKDLPAQAGPAEWVIALSGANAAPPNPAQQQLHSALRSLLQQEAGDMSAVNRVIEGWFNQCMQRASAWYKRNSQLGLFCASAVIVVALNADALQNFNAISTNPALRAALVEHAVQEVKDRSELQTQTQATQGFSKGTESQGPNAAASSSAAPGASDGAKSGPVEVPLAPRASTALEDTKTLLADTQRTLSNYGHLVGWSEQQWQHCGFASTSCWPSLSEGVLKVFGLLVSILAASLGADFWFSMISRLLPLRSVGRSPEEEQLATQPHSRRAQ